MPSWPESFIAEAAERRVALFIGAGISASAFAEHGQAFPTWPSLLNGLADVLTKKTEKDYTKKLVRRGQLLDAAQILVDSLPQADLTNAIRHHIPPNQIVHSSVYEDLLKLDTKTTITTNYDRLIEQNFEHFSAGHAHNLCKYNQDHALDDIRSPMRSILKAHGCITEPSKIILSKASYFHARRDFPGFFSLLTSVMTLNTMLFVGYSFADPDIQLLLENVNMAVKCEHSHFAIVPKFEHRALRDVAKETYNIQFIEYPTGDYKRARELITELVNEVGIYRSMRGIAQ